MQDSTTTSPRDVHVYTQPNCQPCRLTKLKLDKLDVEFEELDATDNAELRELIAQRGLALEAPVVVVWDGLVLADAWTGYRPHKLAELSPSA